MYKSLLISNFRTSTEIVGNQIVIAGKKYNINTILEIMDDIETSKDALVFNKEYREMLIDKGIILSTAWAPAHCVKGPNFHRWKERLILDTVLEF